MTKTALVMGAGGFIGSHLARRLRSEGYRIIGADLKRPEFSPTACHEFGIYDLATENGMRAVTDHAPLDEVYQLAADMGGAGYIFTGEHDIAVMTNSARINLNLIVALEKMPKKPKVFYSSSACIYPARNQQDPDNPMCDEESAYPADPDSEYGWEKLFSERLYLAAARNLGLDVRIARFHNIFGPEGTWRGGREKAPAAICRKVAEAEDGGEIEIWGDGNQTRSFLYIDECVEGIRRLMKSEFTGPVNIGSEEMISIRDLVKIVSSIAWKKLAVNPIPGPTGVRGRNSDNRLLREKLNWEPGQSLIVGMAKTYKWVEEQVRANG